MNVELRSIIAQGSFAQERITLRVLADCDIGEYALMRVAYAEDELLTGVSFPYWFQYKPVKKGDLIVLYTKSGLSSEKQLENGSTAHFFYLSETRPIWKDTEIGALLLYAPSWQAKRADKLYRKQSD